MNRDQLFETLEKLYLELTPRLASGKPPSVPLKGDTGTPPSVPLKGDTESNACGSCKSCCTAGALTHHQVAELELGLIRARLGETVEQDFRTYLSRAKDESGKFRFEICPNYDLDRRGCGIYSVRPFSCRVFGHHRQEGTRFPTDCVFEGKAQEFKSSDYYQAIPLTNRMRWLTREFDLFKGLVPTDYGTMQATPSAEVPVNFDFLNDSDPIDRAIHHQLRGDLSAALEELLRASVDGPPSWGAGISGFPPSGGDGRGGAAGFPPSGGDGKGQSPRSNYFHYSLAMLYSMQDRHEEAIENYLTAAEDVPRADFHYYAGYHYLALGQNREGEAQLMKSLELEPNYAMSLGFLGYLAIMENRFEDASVYLERAVKADPSNCFFHLRLGTAWVQIGRIEDGIRELGEATRFEATRKQAEQILARFAPPAEP